VYSAASREAPGAGVGDQPAEGAEQAPPPYGRAVGHRARGAAGVPLQEWGGVGALCRCARDSFAGHGAGLDPRWRAGGQVDSTQSVWGRAQTWREGAHRGFHGSPEPAGGGPAGVCRAELGAAAGAGAAADRGGERAGGGQDRKTPRYRYWASNCSSRMPTPPVASFSASYCTRAVESAALRRRPRISVFLGVCSGDTNSIAEAS
jgi:hypothetical protein